MIPLSSSRLATTTWPPGSSTMTVRGSKGFSRPLAMAASTTTLAWASVMLDMVELSFQAIESSSSAGEQGASLAQTFGADLVWRAFPERGGRRLIAQVAAVAHLAQPCKKIVPIDHTIARRQPVDRPAHSQRRLGRHVAILEDK